MRSFSRLGPKRLLIFGFALALAFSYLLSAASVYRSSRPTRPAPADAAVVLGAAVWRGGPSPVYEERIEHAVGLWQAGRVDYLIFTGATGHNDQLSEGEVGRLEATGEGVEPGRILVDEQSTTTCQNLRNAQSIASGRGIETFVIVSDPYHMRRAGAVASDLGMQFELSPTSTSRFVTWRTRLPFLLREAYFLLTYELGQLLSTRAAPC